MTENKQIVVIPPEKEIISNAQTRMADVRLAMGVLIDTFEEGSGKDFWRIPGTPTKSLLQRGASKIITYLGLREEFYEVRSVERWDGNDPMFYYQIECRLYDIRTGLEVGRSLGSCSTKEPKYRWRRDGSSQDPYGNQHTVLLMARKRALVSVARRVSGIEGEFTQDMEDFYNGNQKSLVGFDPLNTRIENSTHVQWLQDATGRPSADIATLLGISKWGEWQGTLLEAYTTIILQAGIDSTDNIVISVPEEPTEPTPLSIPENVEKLRARVGGEIADDLLMSFLNIESFNDFTGTVEDAYTIITEAIGEVE